MTPDVEVFVLAYNDAACIRRAVDSAIGQSYKNICVTVLDNGSTDATAEILKQYLHDPRVRIVRNNKNEKSEMGAAALMNSVSPYLSILFADDFYAPQRIETMLGAIGDRAAIFANNVYLNEYEQPLFTIPRTVSSTLDISLMSADDHLYAFFMSGNSLHPVEMLIRRTDYRELGGFKGYMHRIGDMYFFTKLLSCRDVCFLAERLQNVTVWSSRRNESYKNFSHPDAVALERAPFLELYATEPILPRVGEIFSSTLNSANLNSEAERLWFVGHIALGVDACDYQLFGARCLYRALELDEETIRQVCLASGKSVGAYMERLAAKVYRRTSLRAYLKQFSAIRALHGAAKTLLRLPKP